MATNTSINLVNLDFTSLKESFKTYLKTQDVFKDYDFEGSNIKMNDKKISSNAKITD